ncbi:hypothetical protein C0J52_23020 [Blattella germanica]|nr:hypothetical protein C0J52_23020 [Blattella germanica]
MLMKHQVKLPPLITIVRYSKVTQDDLGESNKIEDFPDLLPCKYKRARAELKKRSTDTLRLQKKARKGKSGELQRRVETSLQDVTERRHLLEETEKHAVRAALIEERSRFCLFVAFLKPVVDEEVAMLSELSHLQEVITDLKGSESSWSFQTPPSSPSSLGSRKSSMCSISSLNSSSSGSTKSHHSPNHQYWHRSLSQQPLPAGIHRLSSLSSQDSGFTSQDMLFPRPASVHGVQQVSNMSEHSDSTSSTPSTPYPASGGNNSTGTLPTTTATWPNLQETLQFERAASAIMSDRPHTISSAYERGHQRPPLTVYTFQAPDGCHSQPASPVCISSSTVTVNTIITSETVNKNTSRGAGVVASPQKSPHKPPQNAIYARPPIPQRCSSLERPTVPAKTTAATQHRPVTATTTIAKQIHSTQVTKAEVPKIPKSAMSHVHLGGKAYERGHQRPPLTVYTFQAPDGCHSQPASPVCISSSTVTVNTIITSETVNKNTSRGAGVVASPQKSPHKPPQNAIYARPPIPQRCSSLERPTVPAKTTAATQHRPVTATTTIAKQIHSTQVTKAEVPKIPKSAMSHVHLGGKDSPQPMYVNMHELATMAATKAQEMNFPPPPPELINIPPENQEKTEQGEKDGSTSESSLESSSGYGSQTIIPVDDAAAAMAANAAAAAAVAANAHNEGKSKSLLFVPFLDVSLSVSSLEAASKYCTLPRSGDFALSSGPRRRPVSTTGYPSNTMRNTLLRRGSVQTPKPPPPIRRTSSISSSSVIRQNSGNSGPTNGMGGIANGSLENLPPPPAFLLDSTSSSSSSSLNSSGGGSAVAANTGISVAETVRTLTELKHTPASPSALRRNAGGIRSQSADRRGSSGPSNDATGGLIAALGAKLAPTLSPRNSRRHSEDAGGNPGGRLLQRGVVGPGQGFLQALNSKLALQQQQQQQQMGQQHKAARVRRFIASRTVADPTICHESLMDQIKKGTTLRRTGTVNDRSAPFIR